MVLKHSYAFNKWRTSQGKSTTNINHKIVSERLLSTHKLEHVPVEDVVVGEALSVEQVPEELAQVRVVGLVVEPQRAAEVQVGGKFSCRDT